MNLGKAFFWGIAGLVTLIGGKITYDKYKAYKQGKDTAPQATPSSGSGSSSNEPQPSPGNIFLYAGKSIITGGPNGSNVRTDNYVNDGLINNLIRNFAPKEEIGTFQYSRLGKDNMKWYYVKFKSPVSGYSHGWVPSDVIRAKNP